MIEDANYDIPAMTYRYELDTSGFPESLKLEEYVNDQLQEILEIKEDLLARGAVELLRARGYTVIEPADER